MLIDTDSTQVCNAVEYNMLCPHYTDPDWFFNIKSYHTCFNLKIGIFIDITPMYGVLSQYIGDGRQ